MKCAESCNNRKGKKDKSKCQLPVSLLRANWRQGCLSSPSFGVTGIYFWMQCLGHLCQQLGFLLSSAHTILTKWLQKIFLTWFAITWIFTPYNTCCQRGTCYPHLTVVTARTAEERESLQPDCTPSYVTAASSVGDQTQNPGKQPYFHCGSLPRDHMGCTPLSFLKGSGVFFRLSDLECVEGKDLREFIPPSLGTSVCVTFFLTSGLCW